MWTEQSGDLEDQGKIGTTLYMSGGTRSEIFYVETFFYTKRIFMNIRLRKCGTPLRRSFWIAAAIWSRVLFRFFHSSSGVLSDACSFSGSNLFRIYNRCKSKSESIWNCRISVYEDFYRATLCVRVVVAVARCPSVEPSVTFVYCIQTAEDIVKLLSRPSSPIIL